jgi:hypothetical protein
MATVWFTLVGARRRTRRGTGRGINVREVAVGGILKFFGSVVGIIFLIGLLVVIGLLALIF